MHGDPGVQEHPLTVITQSKRLLHTTLYYGSQRAHAPERNCATHRRMS
jgi:hypothetical protein